MSGQREDVISDPIGDLMNGQRCNLMSGHKDDLMSGNRDDLMSDQLGESMSIQRDDFTHFEKSADNYCFHYDEESHFGPERYDRHRDGSMITGNAARERTRVKTLRGAFLELQRTLPAVPPDTKLSKLDVLVLATTYIAHLMRTLNEDEDENQLFAAHGIMHPVKKWPMRSRLYAGILSSTYPVCKDAHGNRETPWQQQIYYNSDMQNGAFSRKTSGRRYSESHLAINCQNQ